MGSSKWIIGAAAVVLLGSAVMAADDAKPDQTTERPSKVRLHGDVAKLTDLTDDQKAKILDIQRKAAEDVKKIQEQEKADETAVLTDEQKTELVDVAAKAKAERQAHTAETRAKTAEEKAQAAKDKAEKIGMPTTMPSE